MTSIINGAGLNSFRKQFTAGTTFALAEIIDNSIQWKKHDLDCEINIILIERGKANRMRLDEILITDNGQGMSEETLQTCLNFGGGKNHGTEEKGKLGKFGLGLPYASCSQSPDYHVFSWQSTTQIFHTFRDHLKFAPNDPVESELVDKRNSLPESFYELLPELRKYESGTIIQWKKCDSLDVAQAKTLISHINMNLGRIYRHFINKGVNINFKVFRQSGNRYEKWGDLCKPIRIFDPMFLMTNTILPEPFCNQATNSPWGGENDTGIRNINFSEDLPNGAKKEHHIQIRYSMAKPSIQFTNKSDRGGQVEPGKTYYKKATGISLVRANREIKLSHFDFNFPNSSDPANRWWSIEVLFEPKSDDLFGVNANKLDARNFRYLSSEDFAELESGGMVDQSIKLRHELSKEIQTAISTMFKEIKKRARDINTKAKCPSCNEVSFVNGECEKCGHTDENCPTHGISFKDGKCVLCARTPDLHMCLIHKVPLENEFCPQCPKKLGELSDSEKQQLIQIIKNDYPEIKDDEEAIERVLKWFVQSNRKHFIIFTDLRSPSSFIHYTDFQKKFIIIELNITHPFFENFIQKIIDSDEEDNLVPLLLFIASWIETEQKDYSNRDTLDRFRASFGTNLMEVIANWSHIN